MHTLANKDGLLPCPQVMTSRIEWKNHKIRYARSEHLAEAMRSSAQSALDAGKTWQHAKAAAGYLKEISGG